MLWGGRGGRKVFFFRVATPAELFWGRMCGEELHESAKLYFFLSLFFFLICFSHISLFIPASSARWVCSASPASRRPPAELIRAGSVSNSLKQFWNSLEQFWDNLKQFWNNLEQFWSNLKQFWNNLEQFLKNLKQFLNSFWAIWNSPQRTVEGIAITDEVQESTHLYSTWKLFSIHLMFASPFSTACCTARSAVFSSPWWSDWKRSNWGRGGEKRAIYDNWRFLAIFYLVLQSEKAYLWNLAIFWRFFVFNFFFNVLTSSTSNLVFLFFMTLDTTPPRANDIPP